MSQGILFEDTFQVLNLDKDGKKFDRVSRLQARSESYNTHLTLDVNTQIYQIGGSDRFAFMLASTLNPDDMEEDNQDTKVWNPQVLENSRANDYDYVMHGKVYKAHEEGDRISLYVSFGGLLMCIEGNPMQLREIRLGAQIYLLMRKV